MSLTHHIEKLRKIWTPESEIEELFADLNPQTELDSMIRHFLHAIVQQTGPKTVSLDEINVGNLRWEIVNYEPRPGVQGHREVTLWVENN